MDASLVGNVMLALIIVAMIFIGIYKAKNDNKK